MSSYRLAPAADPSAASTGSAPAASSAALTTALAGEYAAVWAYGLIGGRVEDDNVPLARTALEWHRAARDRLRQRMESYGMSPPPPAAAYQTPTVTTGKDAAVLAQQVELALVPRYADLAAAEAGEFRAAAVTDGQTCAARAVTWGAPSQAEPGIRT